MNFAERLNENTTNVRQAENSNIYNELKDYLFSESCRGLFAAYITNSYIHLSGSNGKIFGNVKDEHIDQLKAEGLTVTIDKQSYCENPNAIIYKVEWSK